MGSVLTKEMIEAGARALMNFDPEGTPFSEGAERVYLAMEQARTITPEMIEARSLHPIAGYKTTG